MASAGEADLGMDESGRRVAEVPASEGVVLYTNPDVKAPSFEILHVTRRKWEALYEDDSWDDDC
uniref:Uncharacterized protein n=1 Tax=Phlebotomus papatasi TaxID=29031 RepID=A0A1B0DMG5_PHLPP